MTFPSKSGSNYVDSIVVLVLLPIVWIFICLRIYVRGFLTKQPGWDDAIAVVATFVYTLECVTVLLTNVVTSPTSHPHEPLSQSKAILAFKLYLTTAGAYALSCLFVKLSLGLGYLRILKLRYVDSRWERWVCYAIIVFSCAMNLQFFFSLIFVCAASGFMPLDTAFAIITGKCSLENTGLIVSTYLQSSTNVIVDWILVLLPIPSVLGTILNRKTRVSIIGILLLGAGGSIASIVRLTYVHTFYTGSPKTGAVGAVVSHIEIAGFIMFGCLSTFHPLLAKCFSIGAEEPGESNSYSLKAHDTIGSRTSRQEYSI